MLPIRTILHPTDFSASSRPAFDLACALARDYRADLVIAHAIAPVHVFAPDGIVSASPTEDPIDVHARFGHLRPSDPGVSVDYRAVEGEPADAVLKLARDVGADVIVMGTHGTSGLMRLLVGSVAESVMRKAPCPVLTVRGPFHLTPNPAPAEAEDALPVPAD
jgi:nucleotide-binding universal stress UspA family protein